MVKFNIWLCTAFAALALWATPASADSATYTFEGFTTARIGIAGIHTTNFTLTLTADTSNLIDLGGGKVIPVDHADVFFAGWGTVEIMEPLAMAVNNGASIGGPALDSPPYFFVFYMNNPEWATYDLLTNITLFDATPINQNFPLALSIQSELEFIRISDVTFTARVPEPASMAMFAIGGGLVYWRRRRRRA